MKAFKAVYAKCALQESKDFYEKKNYIRSCRLDVFAK